MAKAIIEAIVSSGNTQIEIDYKVFDGSGNYVNDYFTMLTVNSETVESTLGSDIRDQVVADAATHSITLSHFRCAESL
jgi:hypothetical protein